MKLNSLNLPFLVAATAAISLTMTSCNTKGTDSKESADSANNAKAKTTDSANHALANTSDSVSKTNKKEFKDEAHFIVAASDGGAYEIAAAKLALKHSSDKRVKEFAALMIKDHTKWGDEVMAYAKSKNITVPDSLSNDKKELIKKLGEKGNDKFDVKYMDNMKKDHKNDLDAFTEAESTTKDAALKTTLGKIIPGIQHHLMMATTLDSIIDKEK